MWTWARSAGRKRAWSPEGPREGASSWELWERKDHQHQSTHSVNVLLTPKTYSPINQPNRPTLSYKTHLSITSPATALIADPTFHHLQWDTPYFVISETENRTDTHTTNIDNYLLLHEKGVINSCFLFFNFQS